MTIVVHTIANQDAVARRLIQGSEGSNLTTPTNVALPGKDNTHV